MIAATVAMAAMAVLFVVFGLVALALERDRKGLGGSCGGCGACGREADGGPGEARGCRGGDALCPMKPECESEVPRGRPLSGRAP